VVLPHGPAGVFGRDTGIRTTTAGLWIGQGRGHGRRQHVEDVRVPRQTIRVLPPPREASDPRERGPDCRAFSAGDAQRPTRLTRRPTFESASTRELIGSKAPASPKKPCFAWHASNLNAGSWVQNPCGQRTSLGPHSSESSGWRDVSPSRPSSLTVLPPRR